MKLWQTGMASVTVTRTTPLPAARGEVGGDAPGADVSTVPSSRPLTALVGCLVACSSTLKSAWSETWTSFIVRAHYRAAVFDDHEALP